MQCSHPSVAVYREPLPRPAGSDRRRSKKRECEFCKIVRRVPGSTPLLFEDEHYAAFNDRAPAAARHILVIPKRHIEHAGKLVPVQDYHVVHDMLEIGKQLLGDVPCTKFGFHMAPFISVPHLHLHCFELPHNRGMGWKFNGWVESFGFFVTTERILSRLSSEVPSDSPSTQIPLRHPSTRSPSAQNGRSHPPYAYNLQLLDSQLLESGEILEEPPPEIR